MNKGTLKSLVVSLILCVTLFASVSAFAEPAHLTLKDFFITQEGDWQVLYILPSYLGVEPSAIFITAGFQLRNDQNAFVNINSNNPSNRDYTPLTYDAKWNAYRVIAMTASDLAQWPKKSISINLEYDGASRSWEIPLENVPRASTSSSAPTAPAKESSTIALVEREIFKGDEWKVFKAEKLPSFQTVTLSGWFFTSSLMQGGNEITGSWVSKRNSFVLSPNTDGSVSFYVFINGFWHEARTPPESIRLSTWEHWTAVYDGIFIHLYQNGREVAFTQISDSVTGLNNEGDLFIGADSGLPHRFFYGEIARLMLDEGAATSQAIKERYESQRGAFYQGTVTTKPIPGKENAPVPISVPETSATPVPFPVAKTLGNDNAPVTIEVFASVSEPFFNRWYHETYPAIKQFHIDTGKARLVFKHFTLSYDNTRASRAAECAAQQNKFFEYLDVLSKNLNELQLSSLAEYARTAGAEYNTFWNCLTNEAMDKAVQRDKKEAELREVSGSPTFFIKGKKIDGAQPLSVFEEALTGSSPPRGGTPSQLDAPQGTNPATQPLLPGATASQPQREAPQGTNPAALPSLPTKKSTPATREAPRGTTPSQQPLLPGAQMSAVQQRQAPQGMSPAVHPLLPGNLQPPKQFRSINRESWGRIQIR